MSLEELEKITNSINKTYKFMKKDISDCDKHNFSVCISLSLCFAKNLEMDKERLKEFLQYALKTYCENY